MQFTDEHVLYIETKYSGINPLVAMIDGLPYLQWTPKGRKTRYYMKVTDVIAWHEKELRESNGQSGDKRVLKVLKDRIAAFDAEPHQPHESNDSERITKDNRPN